jgi:hypothetical protein
MLKTPYTLKNRTAVLETQTALGALCDHRPPLKEMILVTSENPNINALSNMYAGSEGHIPTWTARQHNPPAWDFGLWTT